VGSDQVALDFIQPGLEILQGWRLDWAATPPLPYCPHREKVFAYMQSELLFFQLLPVVCHYPTEHHCEEPGSVSL